MKRRLMELPYWYGITISFLAGVGCIATIKFVFDFLYSLRCTGCH